MTDKSLTMTDIKIKIAREVNLTEISDFLCSHFNPHEPIKKFHVRKDEVMDPQPMGLLRDCIGSQTTLMAYSGCKLVGVMIAGKIDSDVADKDLEYSEGLGPKGADIFELSSYLGEKSDVCNRLNVPYSLQFHILSVHTEHCRQGIAKKLFKFCVANGRSKNYPAFSVDATSSYTSKIAESFGMTCLSTVSYEEYNKHIGEKLFVPTGQHTEIKTYAKVYSSSN